MEQDEWNDADAENYLPGAIHVYFEKIKRCSHISIYLICCIQAQKCTSKKLQKIWIQFIRTLKSHSLLFWMIQQTNIDTTILTILQFLHNKDNKLKILFYNNCI